MNQRQPSDEQLGLQIAAGEENSKAAFFVLYERYADISLAYISGRVPAAVANDLHQDVWMRAWNRAEKFVGGSYKAWLLSIAKNRMIDFYRKRARTKEESTANVDSQETEQTPLNEIIDHELKSVLQDCLNELDSRSATIFRRRLEGESYRTICQTVDITENAAHKIVFNAKSQLKDCVQSKTE